MKKNLLSAVFHITILCLNNFSFAQTASSVTVTPITANYAVNPPTVTFEVSWPANSRDADHRAKVWVLVDYRRIKNNAYDGGWLRAGIAGLPTSVGGTPSLEPGNTKGFWLQGPSDGFAFAATVTVPVTVNLTGYAPQFGWCGVASDRPPTAVEQDGYYALYGTQPFIIQTHSTNTGQTVTEPSKAYNKGCIYNLTDATGAPGDDLPPMPAISNFTASTAAICTGESATLTATATNAGSYSFDGGVTWQSTNTKTVSPSASTAYALKVRSAGGCTVTSTKTVIVTVNDPPVPQSLTADPDVICAGESATLTASPEGAASYRLNSGAWQTSRTFSVNPDATTTYTLYIKSAAGCTASLPNAATVTVNALPATPTGASSNSRCGAGTVTFSATAPEDCTIDWFDGPTGDGLLAEGTTDYSPHLEFGTTSCYARARNTVTGCYSLERLQVTATVNARPTGLSLSGATVCSGEAATLTADAAGADSYSLDGLSWQPATTFTDSPTSTTTYALYVQSAEGCTATLADAATVTVNEKPTITLASGSSAQTVTAGAAITQIKYTTAHATGANPTGLPPGVTGSWYANTYTVSGAPTSGGIYNYTITTANSNGCTDATATGTITVLTGVTYTNCTLPMLNLGTLGFTSSSVWTRNGITISSPVTATYCDKEQYAGGTSGVYQADCRTSNNAPHGHLLSWCLMKQYATQMCNSPWRVPTRADYIQYAGVPATSGVCGTIMIGVDGWELGCMCYANGTLWYVNAGGYAWLGIQLDDDHGSVRSVNDYCFYHEVAEPMSYGVPVRCVRDAQ